MAKHKVRWAKGALSGFLPCLIISVGILVASVMVAAFIVTLGSYRVSELGLFSLSALILSAALSGGISARISGDEDRLRISVLCPFTVILIMLLISVILGASPSLSMLMNYLCYMGIYLLAAMLFKPRRKRGKRTR
ncbi:MAG: hypothetical protein IJY69_05755 [Clostridia bacterium]|nr:hypothetical protein [Clostridia bacterium]